jgi:hypothetical protein
MIRTTSNHPGSAADGAPSGRWDRAIEIVLAIVLSVAGLLTSWTSYQSALWRSGQQIAFAKASALRVTAASERTRADAVRAVDVGLFSAWLAAESAGDRKLADFYRARFPDAFSRAFESWMALEPLRNPSAPAAPFAMEAYRLPEEEQASALQAQADAVADLGGADNEISDSYTRVAVVLATAMFMAGICQVFRIRYVRVVIALFSALICSLGLAMSLGLPVERSAAAHPVVAANSQYGTALPH